MESIPIWKKYTYLLYLVSLLKYNIEPWLTMSREFVMIMLMPGSQAVNGKTFNIYIQPLVDKFLDCGRKELWRGMPKCVKVTI